MLCDLPNDLLLYFCSFLSIKDRIAFKKSSKTLSCIEQAIQELEFLKRKTFFRFLDQKMIVFHPFVNKISIDVQCVIQGRDLARIASACPHITHLDLRLAEGLVDASIAQVNKMALKILYLPLIEGLTEECLQHLSSLKIEELYLGGLLEFSEKGASYLKEMPLNILDVSWCRKKNVSSNYLEQKHVTNRNPNKL